MTDESRTALNILLKLTRTFTQDLPLEEALGVVTDSALQLLQAEHTSVRILEETGTELLCGARSGKGSGVGPMRFRKGEGIAGWVVDHGEVTRIDDAAADARFKPAQHQGFTIGSILAVPLWTSGKVIGVLAASVPSPGGFSESDELLAVLLANCSVAPIEKARLKRLALTDHLTLAYSHRLLMPRLEEEMARSRRHATALTILLMDLDGFKQTNDAFGHAVGDRVLKNFATRVRENVRLNDVLIRRGGDEFVLIIPQSATDRALAAAERIRATCADQPIAAHEGNSVTQTVSIGLATWDGSESGADLEKRADEAMYRAKALGGNRVQLAEMLDA